MYKLSSWVERVVPGRSSSGAVLERPYLPCSVMFAGNWRSGSTVGSGASSSW